MTIGTLKMPRMGETMEEGMLVDWLVTPGQSFKRGQEILEVETDKTIVEFPALGDGTVVETLIEIGERVQVGTPIARIDVGDGPDWTDDGSSKSAPDTPAAETAPPPPPEESDFPPVAGAETEVGSAHVEKADGPVRATPVARKIARQRGLDLSTLIGTGRRGRIERDDVETVGGASLGELRSIAGVTCREKGPASGEPTVFLHGFGADHTAWNGVQSRLEQARRRSISVDLPGHGSTTHDARSTDDLAGPVDRALTELGLGPVHVVAHSMGAIAAVRLARGREVKSLTLIAPAGLGYSIDGSFLTGLARAQTSGEISHLLNRITDGPHGLSSAMLTQIQQQMARGRLTTLADSLIGGHGQAISIRADLGELARRLPVRLILGHRDQILDWHDALGVSSRIAIHHLPRAGHSPHWEALADVVAMLEDTPT